MVLTVDVGNTNIVLGIFDGEKLIFVSRISTDAKKTDLEYAVVLKGLVSLHGVSRGQIEAAIISSVVPPLSYTLKKAVLEVYNVEAMIVGPGIKTGINLLVDNPSQVGADLICGCVAAHNLYKKNTLVVDMGTAVKMLVVDETGAFVGVSIIPGVEISLRALAGGTAQLPLISLENPGRVVAKNTVECMKSGAVYGTAAMVDGMIERIKEEFGKDLYVVATGGYAGAIIPYCKHNIDMEEDLILKGLYLIYKKNK